MTTPDARSADLGPRRRSGKAEWSENSATGETKGGHDEQRGICGHTVALNASALGDLMGIHSSHPDKQPLGKMNGPDNKVIPGITPRKITDRNNHRCLAA